jgi:hypothetical protein
MYGRAVICEGNPFAIVVLFSLYRCGIVFFHCDFVSQPVYYMNWKSNVLSHSDNPIPFLFNRLFRTEYVGHSINVKIETGHFMMVWMVGREVYCYIYICRFSVDAQFNLIMLSLDGEVKRVSDVIFFLGYFEI